MARIILSGGIVYDGTGAPGVQADVAMEGKKIVEIGHIVPAPEDTVLHIDGLAVSPGFIDTHSHSDLIAMVEPEILPKLQQGITTEVLGQDGVSLAPIPVQYQNQWRKNLAGLDGDSEDVDWDALTSVDGYLKQLEAAAPALNMCYLIPHGNVRMAAMGLEERDPTPEELEEMCRLVRVGMQEGALGLSSGLIYMPCAYSKLEELVALCKVVAEEDGIFVVHQRSEADNILESMEEILEIGRRTGVRLHFSHFKICGKKNWKYLPDMLKLLDEAKAEGLNVTFDQYPYVAGSTMMGVLLPPWVHDGGTEEELERLHHPELRERMIHDIQTGIQGWDNFIDFAGFDGIYITSVKTPENQDVVGLSLTALSQKWHEDPYNATFDLLEHEENAVGMVDFYGVESHIGAFMTREEMNVCTDGLLCGKPHPRVYGAFPRVLGRYVREQNQLTLEQAIYKMTGKAAQSMKIRRRGVLQTGYFADICVFDPATVVDKGTFPEPEKQPEGIVYVFVNGVMEMDHGTYTGQRAGRVLRKKGEHWNDEMDSL